MACIQEHRELHILLQVEQWSIVESNQAVLHLAHPSLLFRPQRLCEMPPSSARLGFQSVLHTTGPAQLETPSWFVASYDLIQFFLPPH